MYSAKRWVSEHSELVPNASIDPPLDSGGKLRAGPIFLSGNFNMNSLMHGTEQPDGFSASNCLSIGDRESGGGANIYMQSKWHREDMYMLTN